MKIGGLNGEVRRACNGIGVFAIARRPLNGMTGSGFNTGSRAAVAPQQCEKCSSTCRVLAPPWSCSPAAASSARSEEHTSELQSLMRISYAVFCLKQKKTNHTQ